MKEIKVNEYVRTENGIIDKVDSLCGMIENTVYLKQQSLWFNMDYIVNHSKQPIDLIENADILKIKISEEWVEKQDTIKFVVVGQTYTITEIKSCLEDGLFEIIQILTHEQFESNCYKVGGEDE